MTIAKVCKAHYICVFSLICFKNVRKVHHKFNKKHIALSNLKVQEKYIYN